MQLCNPVLAILSSVDLNSLEFPSLNAGWGILEVEVHIAKVAKIKKHCCNYCISINIITLLFELYCTCPSSHLSHSHPTALFFPSLPALIPHIFSPRPPRTWMHTHTLHPLFLNSLSSYCPATPPTSVKPMLGLQRHPHCSTSMLLTWDSLHFPLKDPRFGVTVTTGSTWIACCHKQCDLMTSLSLWRLAMTIPIPIVIIRRTFCIHNIRKWWLILVYCV